MELKPLWVPLGGYERERHGFIFLCPHCRTTWLLVKCIYAGLKEQNDIVRGRGIDVDAYVPADDECIWQFSGGFGDLTVNPGISAVGHGPTIWITNGEVELDQGYPKPRLV